MTYPDRYGEEAHRSLAKVLGESDDDDDDSSEWECECGARNDIDEAECTECGAAAPDGTDTA